MQAFQTSCPPVALSPLETLLPTAIVRSRPPFRELILFGRMPKEREMFLHPITTRKNLAIIVWLRLHILDVILFHREQYYIT